MTEFIHALFTSPVYYGVLAAILVFCGISCWRYKRFLEGTMCFLIAGVNVLQILDLLNVIDIW